MLSCIVYPASVLFGSIGLNIFNHEAVRHLSSRFGIGYSLSGTIA